MKLIMIGDAGHTGFGTVTTDLGRELLASGVDVRFIVQNRNSEPLPDPFASRTWDLEHGTFDLAGTLADGFRDRWKADAILVLYDFWPLRDMMLRDGRIAEAFQRTPTFHYCPVEGVDLPPSWKQVWDVVQPIAMSEFGAAQIARVTGRTPPVVYHGVDTASFYPVSRTRPGLPTTGEAVVSTRKAKEACDYPDDRILVLRVDRHMPRKRHNSLIRAMVPVMAEVPNLDLVLHCSPRDFGGILPDTVSKVPAEFRERFKFTNRGHNTFTGYARNDLNILYNAADLYVSTGAEGFGLTIAEAVACGVPTVGMAFSAVPEVVGPAGVLVPPAYLYDNPYDHLWAAVDEGAFGQAVIDLAKDQTKRRRLGRKGPDHVGRNFSWARSAARMLGIIEGSLPAEVAA